MWLTSLGTDNLQYVFEAVRAILTREKMVGLVLSYLLDIGSTVVSLAVTRNHSAL